MILAWLNLVPTFLALTVGVQAFPTQQLDSRQAITTLSAAQIASFKPFTFFASTAYCKPAQTANWTCGANCNANPTFQPIASGGDGVVTQFCKFTSDVESPLGCIEP